MPQQTVYVAHPEAHSPTDKAVREARKAENIPDEAEVAGFVQTSGEGTKYTFTWADTDPEKASLGKAPARRTSGDGSIA